MVAGVLKEREVWVAHNTCGRKLRDKKTIEQKFLKGNSGQQGHKQILSGLRYFYITLAPPLVCETNLNMIKQHSLTKWELLL